ncbi:hypothetical protein KVT40_000956 [Elsinoe batatas]|uniref:Uncharacterized protein n=1 Tax=Elsinoe batatas TaxID=2601811 RepID=A0A8K0PJ46_9PEZI|nr:hypothetical protein KVT40_000956 [Elsinoe batatas]
MRCDGPRRSRRRQRNVLPVPVVQYREEGRVVSPRVPPFGFPRACALLPVARRAARPSPTSSHLCRLPSVSHYSQFLFRNPLLPLPTFFNPSHTPHLPITPSIACQRISAPICTHI